jgi:TonB-linked SusC/RagA family outer membrane protein
MNVGVRTRLTLAAALFVAVLITPEPGAAQAIPSVAGTVTDSTTQQGVPGAQVTVVGTAFGTITDDAGRYALRGLPIGNLTLRIQRLGYGRADRRVTVRAGETVTADFVLSPVARVLSEVVATGYGTEDRRRVTGAQSHVSGSELANNPTAGIDHALQGKTPGVQVIQNAGNPGNGVTVRIRGSASLSANNQPLWVVDGVPMIREAYSQLDMAGQDVTAVTGISADEIESIDILKDAAAAAIYGSNASNGVVIITTKRGQAGAGRSARVTFNTYTGWQEATKTVPMLSSAEYIEYMFEGGLNDGYTEQELIDDWFGFNRLRADSVDTDWQHEILRTAPVYDLNLGVSGGTDRFDYFFSGSHYAQTGIVIGSAYNRQNIRANVGFRASDRLQMRTSLGLSREDHERNENDNTIDGVVTNAIANQPVVPVRRGDGSFTGISDGLEYTNPVAVGSVDDAESRVFRGLGSLEATYNFTDRLRLTSRTGLDVLNLRDLRWFSPQVEDRYYESAGGAAQQGNNTVQRFLVETYATFDPSIGETTQLTLTGGGGVQWNRSELQFMHGEGFASEQFRYPGNAGKITDYRGRPTAHNLVSAFGRGSLSLRDRYFLTASVRADGSSRFGENNRYGIFPALSVGWMITDEPFMQSAGRFGDLKIRASYGVTGNQGIDNFAPLARFGKANYADEPGLAPSAIGNPNLKWETTREIDVGFDLSVLDGRVSLLGDYYLKKTDDLLVNRPITGTSGFTNFWSNVGNIENTGYELALSSAWLSPRDTRGLGWNTEVNISWNRNEVTKLFDGQPFNTGIRGVNRVEEGAPIGAFHTLIFDGVDPDNGDAIYRDICCQIDPVTGDRIPGPDGEVNSDDETIVGSPHPTYWGGLNNTFTWRGFDLRAFFQFSHGAEVYNAMRIFSDDGGYYYDNKFRDVLRRWRQPGDVTDQPRASFDGTSGGNEVSSRYVEDGSYIRLGELTLGYRIPAARIGRFNVFDEARLYVSGRNIKTWTDYSGYNPDVNSLGATARTSLGTDFYAYPVARTFTIGISGAW